MGFLLNMFGLLLASAALATAQVTFSGTYVRNSCVCAQMSCAANSALWWPRYLDLKADVAVLAQNVSYKVYTQGQLAGTGVINTVDNVLTLTSALSNTFCHGLLNIVSNSAALLCNVNGGSDFCEMTYQCASGGCTPNWSVGLMKVK